MLSPRGHLTVSAICGVTFLCVVAICFGERQASGEGLLDPLRPHYVVRLSLNEFSILNATEVDGLRKYGGTADFQVHMALEGTNLAWTITTDNPRQLEVWSIYLGEKAVSLMREINLQNIDPTGRIAIQAITSLSQKLEFAQKNPVWTKVKVAGTITPQGTNWVIQTADGTLAVVGTNRSAVSGWAGRRVVADGFVKTPGQFEPTRLIEQRTNTVELFVMSFCPFGQRAETKLLGFLKSTNFVAAPKLEIHYLFYKQQKDGMDVYTSLHGEDEVTENLVQMILRDNFSTQFEPYLRLRASSGDVPWQKLLAQMGWTNPAIDGLEATIASQRDRLIQTEYDYVVGQYGITDGSPSYVWEGQRVMDLTKLERFKALKDFTGEACNK
jgi:hypothetical protein